MPSRDEARESTASGSGAPPRGTLYGRSSELRALETALDEVINSGGARLVTLRTLIAETEKTARKTPPKTLVAEKERVATAKVTLPLLVAECVALTAEQAMLEALDRPETATNESKAK